METIELGTTGRKTTRLGFGCSSLMGAMGRKESVATLEAAFDAGFRHFDVAPMYGFGQAESCVGEFLGRHRTDVTVATKYGIPPAENRSWISAARSLARPIVAALPGLKGSLNRLAGKATRPAVKASFTGAQAKDSLHRSLRELRTDRIDVWLLHDVELADLQDDELLQMLEDSVQAGVIGTSGVGSDRCEVEAIAAAKPAYCRTVQFEWSVMDAPITGIDGFRIHHRSLAHNFLALRRSLTEDLALKRRWSDEVDADLGDSEVLAALMLKAALLENQNSVILVSSKNPSHMRHNVAVAEDSMLEARARRLYKVVRRDRMASGKISAQVAG